MSKTRVKYTGTALPTDSDTFVLFTTVETGKGASFFAMLGIETFQAAIKCSHACTLKSYASKDRGTTWEEVSTTALTLSTTLDNVVHYMVGSYPDWKLSLINGGTTQTTFVCGMSLSTKVAT